MTWAAGIFVLSSLVHAAVTCLLEVSDYRGVCITFTLFSNCLTTLIICFAGVGLAFHYQEYSNTLRPVYQPLKDVEDLLRINECTDQYSQLDFVEASEFVTAAYTRYDALSSFLDILMVGVFSIPVLAFTTFLVYDIAKSQTCIGCHSIMIDLDFFTKGYAKYN